MYNFLIALLLEQWDATVREIFTFANIVLQPPVSVRKPQLYLETNSSVYFLTAIATIKQKDRKLGGWSLNKIIKHLAIWNERELRK